MKKLKYIKLFEAFDSNTLNATLKYIKTKEDKKIFLSNLKKLCDKFDIPESKLSDDLFTYLPFNKALKFNNIVSDDQPCDAVGEFIEGEKCDNGKVKRPWGRGFRLVDCSSCNGTGIKSKKSKLSLIKFWFDVNGSYIATTAVDGVYRPSTNSTNTTFSTNISDYEVVKRIPKAQIKNQLQTGDIISLDLTETSWNGQYTVETQIVAYVYKETRHNETKLYAIQNLRGRYPTAWSDDWRSIGSQSWNLTPTKCDNINLLKPKDNITGQDPYGYNTLIDTNMLSIRPVQVNSTLKNANFAIILDFSKLEKLEFSKKELKSTRAELKTGATALISDVDVKKTNIKRYFDKISASFKLVGELDDISKFNRMVVKAFGRNSTYLLNSGYSYETDSLSNIANSLFKMIKAIKTAEKSDLISEQEGLVGTAVNDLKSNSNFLDIIIGINHTYTDILNNSVKKNEFVNDKIKLIKSKLKTNDPNIDFNEEDLKVLSNIDNLSMEINRYLSSIKVENLDDVEFLIQEIFFIKSLLKSNRMNLTSLNTFFDRMRPGSYYSESISIRNITDALFSKRDSYTSINNGIQSIISIIRKK